MSTQLLLGYISTFSPLVPLITGIRRKLSLIWIYVLVGLVFNILIAINFYSKSELLANIYVILEFFIVSAYFFNKLAGTHRLVILVGVSAFLFATYNTVISGFNTFNGFSAAILSFIYIIYCILALYAIMIDHTVRNIFESPFFLITIALFIYFSGMFMLFSSTHYLRTHEAPWGFEKHSLMSGVWMINSTCNIIQSILFTWAFMRKEKT